MENIKGYLHSRTREIVLSFAMIMIFMVVEILNDNTLRDIQYATLIAMTLLVIAGFFDYIFYIAKINKIKKLNINDIDRLISYSGEMDKQYLNIIKEQYEEIRRIFSDNRLEKERLIEDYSIWIHQIKTPISILSIMMENVEGEMQGEMKKELFKINQYTDMALNNIRLQCISNDLDIGEYDLSQMISEVLYKFNTLIKYGNNKVEVEEMDIMVVTDFKWFTYMIEQFVSNGLKYTKNGTIKIYLQGDELVIEDDGCGIKEENMPKLFTRGFTGIQGRTNRRATGIGLYMSKKIGMSLGHSLRIESKEGIGTKVFVGIKPKRDEDRYEIIGTL